MKTLFLVIFASIVFVTQISFSIYYSIQIVDENTLVNSLQSKIYESEIVHQVLKYQLAKMNSVQTISESLVISPLKKIETTIDLN